MPILCNHTAVGILARRGGKLVLLERVSPPISPIERSRPPIMKAPPTRHVEELTEVPTGSRREDRLYRLAGVRGLREDTGLTVRPSDLRLLMISERVPSLCGRQPADGGEPWHLWRVYEADIPPEQVPHGDAAESAALRWYTHAEIRALPDLEPVWRGFLDDLRII